MSEPVLGVTMLAILVVTIMLGFPTAFTLMALGVIFGYLGFGNLVFNLLVQRAFATMTNDVLIAVPLFVFMGYIIERAGILDRLFRSIQLAMGPVRGSLALATLLTCTIFATATGIVGASVTLMGLLAMPAMLRAGYDIKLSAGTIAAGGTLGILIPPSVLLILYGATAGVSVPRLYAAAFFPGLMLASLYFIYIIIRVNVNPKLGPPLPKEERNVPVLTILFMLLTSFFPITLLILSVLGSILIGLATPSEAAALGALGGLILAGVYGRLNFENLREAVFLTIRTSAMVGWLFVGSSLFAAVFARLGGSDLIGQWVNGLGLSAFQFFWLALLVIFFLGWPLEWTEIIVIFLPLFLPLLAQFNIDPLFFGIMVALNLQTAFLSPPVAMSAFYLKGVSPPYVTLNQIFNGMYPYMGLQIVSMIVLYFWSDLALWLPNWLYGSSSR
ncbi:MAG: TRAP transporter large permease subunit [Chloroflexi bacterium]|nr:TRAP transporter large permease subunit [Chloroflexota bacterium]